MLLTLAHRSEEILYACCNNQRNANGSKQEMLPNGKQMYVQVDCYGTKHTMATSVASSIIHETEQSCF